MKTKLSILGGGISGITTALTLQLLGYQTTLYTEHLVDEQAPEDPRFASLYPAASVIPHSVQSDKTDRLFDLSNRLFQFLFEEQATGIQLHRHYELFESETPDPPYARFLKGYERISQQKMEVIPHRNASVQLSGWLFDCFVAEWPIYIQHLYKWYRKAGGQLNKQKVSPAQLKHIPGNILINCTGIWSKDLFDDPEPRRVVKGHLLYVENAPLVNDSAGHIPSYNYTPDHTVYADPEGNATDVYFYPRTNGWILGGSRIKGLVDEEGRWSGNEQFDTLEIGGMEIPRQIYELNQQILSNTYDITLDSFTNIQARAGYRYVRTHKGQGLRLDSTKEYGKTVIHNYGHGGAGVTLSWGCALEVERILQKSNTMTSEENGNNLKNALKDIL